MRSIWKGAITFGLVNVPVKLYSATEDHDVNLHQVHDADGGRIRYQRRCEVCDKVVDYEHIDKAYAEGQTTIVLTEEDLASLPEERSKQIEVVEFVPSDQLDPIMFERSYFLEPEKTAVKAYALLCQTLRDTDRTAIVQFSLRQKTRLGALRNRPSSGSGNGVLMLQSLLWDDEVRDADFETLKSPPEVSPQEVKMAAALVDNMSTDFSPEKFSDDYQAQLKALIAAKVEQGDGLDTAATFGDDAGSTPGGDVVDLMEALRQSVERNRASRSTSKPAKSATKQPPRQQTPGRRKSSARKTAGKKAS